MAYKINLNHSDDELYHYGVKGRSGRRPGYGIAKRYKLKKRLKKNENSDNVENMSKKELIEKTNRMRAERDYYITKQQLASSRPIRKSRGKEFVKKVGNEVVIPAAINVGRQYLENVLRKQLGLSTPKKKKNK